MFQILANRDRVLGLNQRYLGYIRPYNRRGGFRIADDKVLTKQKLSKAGIPVPPLVAVISSYEQLSKFDLDSLPRSFVMKPVRGLEGGGIEIFYNRKDDDWIKSNGRKVSKDELMDKFRDILDGKFSLHNQPDEVLIEERIRPHKNFRYYTYKGAPDIRVIVFNRVPVMAMLRLPTESSQGKGNLKQGAIGCGIDITAGRVTQSILGKSGRIEYVPHSGVRLSGLRIPYWNKILRLAVESAQVTKLGFASIDFLIDRDNGPMVIEVNARTGLSVQLAEQDGLLWRLKRVEGLKVNSVEKGIRIGKDLFGGEIEEILTNASGKTLIGIIENITVYGKEEKKEKVKSKIDTGADSTSIDRSLLEKLGYAGELKLFDDFIAQKKAELGVDLDQIPRGKAGELADKLTNEINQLGYGIEKIVAVFSSHGVSYRPYLKISVKLAGEKWETTCSVYDRSKLTYPVIIGRKSMVGRFLVDPSKTR